MQSVLAIAHSFPGSAIGWFPGLMGRNVSPHCKPKPTFCEKSIAYAVQDCYPYQYVDFITIR